MAEISVLVVEGDPFFGRAMMRELGRGRAGRLVDGLVAARAVLVHEQPRLVVVDVRLPDGCGLDLVEQPPPLGMLGRGGRAHVVIVTAEGSSGMCARAAKAGAQFLDKAPDGEPRLFFEALCAIHVRACAPHRGTEERKLQVVAELARERRLTPAERRVLELIALGATREEVAVETGTTLRTARCHIAAIVDKLHPVVRERSIHKLECWVIDRALYDAVHERA